jgi:hypothetical protein
MRSPIRKTSGALLLVVVATYLSASTAQPDHDDKTLMDSGNAFVRLCSSMEKLDADKEMAEFERVQVMGCAAYVQGLSDGMVFESGFMENGKIKAPLPYCLAEGVEVGQKVRITLKYIRDNPAKAHLPTRVLFFYAMGQAFPPCPAGH